MTHPPPPIPPLVSLRNGDAYRVLSVRQPWAWAIIHAGKDVENRPRRSHYRGPLLIHASAAAPGEAAVADLEDNLRQIYGRAIKLPASLPTGELVGLVDLVDCMDRSQSLWAQRGAFHLVLSNPRSVMPGIRLSGKLGIWNWTVGTEALGWTPKASRSAIGVVPPEPSRSPSQAAATKATRDGRTVAPPKDIVEVRPVDELNSDSIMAALRAVATMSPQTEMELLSAAGRALGYRRVGSAIRRTLKAQIKVAVRRGVLAKDVRGLRLLAMSVDDYAAESLVAAILAVVPKRSAIPRAEVTENAARHLGFVDAEPAQRMVRAIEAAIAAGTLEEVASGSVRRVVKT